jgi:hypothetical protein
MTEANINLTLNEASSLLLGAALVKMADDVWIGLILFGIAAAVKVALAILNKRGIVVTGMKK